MNRELKLKRESAGLTLKQVGEVLGRTGEWLRQVERGRIKISPKVESLILQSIYELTALRKVETSSRQDLFADHRLPRRLSASE